ncbi:unnamed protein product [Meloidogyne enterolobii]|uniref:Uncharacterized protein n=4 Tax=Meloidogyne enterolobii TaxID=390850 RepID=A0A6V7U5X4_MELEN|nr:unnamed protein product [Meloidogyne enterolobii]CAD2189604.1 unnamed protein product [Meloidogyne enterolobii]
MLHNLDLQLLIIVIILIFFCIVCCLVLCELYYKRRRMKWRAAAVSSSEIFVTSGQQQKTRSATRLLGVQNSGNSALSAGVSSSLTKLGVFWPRKNNLSAVENEEESLTRL